MAEVKATVELVSPLVVKIGSAQVKAGDESLWQVNKNEVVMKGKTFRVGVPAASYPLHYLEHKITPLEGTT